MSLYFGIPLLLGATVLQSVWLENLNLLGGRPDLTLLLVVTWSIIRGQNEGVVWGFVGGIFCDLLSGSSFGLWTIALTLTAFVAGQPWVQTLGPTSIRLALMSVIGTLVAHSTLLVLMALLDYPIAMGYAYGTTVGPAALFNFILSPFIFVVLVWFHQRSLQRREMRL
jgi:rod shape-determining protein MreD